VLDIDDTFDRVHGAPQLRLFNAHHDDYGFQPIVVFDREGRFVTAVLRPGKRPSGVEVRGFGRRLVGAIRPIGPRSRSCCAPTVIMRLRKCSTGAGQAPSIGSLAWPPMRLFAGTSWRWRKARQNGSSWRRAAASCAASCSSTMPPRAGARVERIIARVEAGPRGTDIRFIVTNLEGGRAKHVYERLYCARGQAENHVKARRTTSSPIAHLPCGRGQPVSSVSARWRLLALVVDAPRHAQTFDLASYAV
jgi:hypothetical protein